MVRCMSVETHAAQRLLTLSSFVFGILVSNEKFPPLSLQLPMPPARLWEDGRRYFPADLSDAGPGAVPAKLSLLAGRRSDDARALLLALALVIDAANAMTRNARPPPPQVMALKSKGIRAEFFASTQGNSRRGKKGCVRACASAAQRTQPMLYLSRTLPCARGRRTLRPHCNLPWQTHNVYLFSPLSCSAVRGDAIAGRLQLLYMSPEKVPLLDAGFWTALRQCAPPASRLLAPCHTRPLPGISDLTAPRPTPQARGPYRDRRGPLRVRVGPRLPQARGPRASSFSRICLCNPDLVPDHTQQTALSSPPTGTTAPSPPSARPSPACPSSPSPQPQRPRSAPTSRTPSSSATRTSRSGRSTGRTYSTTCGSRGRSVTSSPKSRVRLLVLSYPPLLCLFFGRRPAVRASHARESHIPGVL